MKKSDRRRIRVRFAILTVLLLIGILLDINAGYSGAACRICLREIPSLCSSGSPGCW